MKHLLSHGIVRFATVVLMMSHLCACNRQYSPPMPISGAASATAPASPEPIKAAAADASTKLPYGADAPVASNNDSNRLDTRGLDQPAPVLSPDQQLAAAPAAAGPAASKVELTADELNFFSHALEESAFHFQTSQLALKRANDSTVKSYAALLVYDYPQLNNKLLAMARKKGLNLSQALTEAKRERLEKLMSAPELEFDKLYLTTAGAENQMQLIALFEKTSRETNDPDLKSFLASILPTVQAHLRSAEHLPMHG